MADFWLEWNGDFVASAQGGLLLATGDDEARQRLQRRIFTAVYGYIWHRNYAAGLPQKVGDPWSPSDIQAIVMSQVALEASVAASPPAQIGVAEIVPGMISIDVAYTDAQTGEAVQFNITA
jgi:hypothetical protein